MPTTRNFSALTIHGAGWVALLTAVLVVRVGLVGDGWATWPVLTVGVFMFAGCAAWSVSAILGRNQAVEATTQNRVLRPTPPYSARFASFPSRDALPRSGSAMARRHVAHS